MSHAIALAVPLPVDPAFLATLIALMLTGGMIGVSAVALLAVRDG